MSGRSGATGAYWARALALPAAAALLLSACGDSGAPASTGDAAPASTSMSEMSQSSPDATPGMNEEAMEEMTADAPRVPPVFGYYAGEEVFFMHTETSSDQIAATLERMMGSPVPVVESLAEVPEQARSAVYVFTNGVKPTDTSSGPLGFAPDVFDTAPGDARSAEELR